MVRIAPTFGGIHLEDISAPECFEIERRLIERLPQPVMHDDVHGTAVVSLAAPIVACRYAGIELQAATVGQLGLGAAGYGIASLMVDGGVRRVIAFDPLEASHARAREHGIEISTMEHVMAEADVVVATTGRPGLIEPAMIRPGQVILALTNPDPEIEPELAEAAGAAFAADGRSVNNVLGYPGIFRGALQAGAAGINVEMKLAAARAIAELARDGELVPNALDQRVHDAVAEAVKDRGHRAAASRGPSTPPPSFDRRKPAGEPARLPTRWTSGSSTVGNWSRSWRGDPGRLGVPRVVHARRSVRRPRHVPWAEHLVLGLEVHDDHPLPPPDRRDRTAVLPGSSSADTHCRGRAAR